LKTRFGTWLGLAALVALLDQLSKHLVMMNLHYGEVVPVTDFFDLVLVFNPGAAFSFLAQHSGWQRWFFIALALAISTWMLFLIRRHEREVLLPFAFAMIVGGAIGNVIDRFVFGAVVDFLYFHVGKHGWPAFNLADSAITLGVAVMLWAQYKHSRTESAQENPS
jgi:signal peptidase II